jgi:hypothetical protein
MKNKKLSELARTIRSKNAGCFAVTIEIIFDDLHVYKRIKANNLVSRETIAEAYGVRPERITNFHYFDPGMGIKANFLKECSSGGAGETDVYGCQQYAPVLQIEVPWE